VADFTAVSAAALARAETLVREWLPGGKLEGREYCGARRSAGGPGNSLKVNLDTGQWAHFSGEARGGDLVSLLAYVERCSQLEACKSLSEQLNMPVKSWNNSHSNGNGAHRETNVSIAEVIPDSAPAPPELKHQTALWWYTDREGRQLFAVARVDNGTGKSFRQWTWRGGQWVAKAWDGQRPLYNLPLLDANPCADVLIVEGEKCADAASAAGYTALTWSGGAQSYAQTDWTALKGRRVILWPDADEAGRKAIGKIAALLISICPAVHIASDTGRPPKWDVADLINEGGSIALFLKDHAKAVVSTKGPAAVETVEFSTFDAVLHMELEPPVPLVEEMIYPGAWLMVGRPKIGKSWLLMQLAFGVAQQSTFLGFRCNQGDVLYIASEDNDLRLQSRQKALGVATGEPRILVANQQQFMAIAAQYASRGPFTQFLDRYLEAHPAVRLVLIDTETTVRQMWQHHDDDQRIVKVTDSDYRQTRAYDELALRRGIAIVLVNHSAKRKGEWFDIHELINRSNTALAGCSGSIAMADPPDADPLDESITMRVLGVRGRDLHKDLLLAVHQEKELAMFVCDGPYAQVRQTNMQVEILQALETLMPGLEDGKYLSSAEIAEAMGQGRQAVKRCISRLLESGARTWKRYRIESKQGVKGGLRLEKIK
jgi:hypothetical protein